MKCEEIKRFTGLYLDREFDERETAVFETHLGQCENCHQLVQSQAAFKDALRKKLGPAKSPATVRERIVDQAFSEAFRERSPSGRRAWLAVAASVVVLAAVGALAYRFLPETHGQDEIDLIVEESVTEHEVGLPPEAVGSGEEVAGYVSQKAEVDTTPPLREDESTHLQGVRLTRIGDVRAIHYKYLHRGRRVSVVQIPRKFRDLPSRPMGRDYARVLFNGAKNGYSVTLFESPGFTNTVISDMPQSDQLRLIPASL